MRVGFITQLLWPRYGPFWEKLLSDAGIETIHPELERVEMLLDDRRLEGIPGVSFRLAAAQALALQDVDAVLAPELNPDQEVPRGSGQDPWVASFPDALAKTLGGLPQTLAVPATLETDLERLVINTLHMLSVDAALVRRTWERHRSSARPPRHAGPRWQLRPSERTTVGVVGQPWLLSDALLSRLESEGKHLVSQHQLEPALLRREGARVDERLVDTDKEVLGAARFLERKGSVSGIVMVADQTSGSDAWLARQLERRLHKPLTLTYLDELVDPAELAGLFLPVP